MEIKTAKVAQSRELQKETLEQEVVQSSKVRMNENTTVTVGGAEEKSTPA